MPAAELELLWRLGVALAIGLMIGLERGFHLRDQGEGGRVAGFRTFALVGLAGGIAAALSGWAGPWLLVAGLLALTVFLAVGAHHMMKGDGDIGITTLVAALLTFLLGAAAGFGELVLAAIGGVVTALLLGVKRPMHRLLERLQQDEVLAVIKLLIVGVVILPLLPDRDMGPWDAVNPRQLWWMVVLVVGVSSAGYFAMKFLGAERGLLVTALLGGLASSTATTLALAQRLRGASPPQDQAAATRAKATKRRTARPRRAKVAALPDGGSRTLTAAATLAASAMIAPRLLAIGVVVSPGLDLALALPLGALFLALAAGAALLWRRNATAGNGDLGLGNPFEIGPALKLGLLIAVIFLLTAALPRWLGDGGVFLLAALSGLADVAAVTLSYASEAEGGTMAPGLALWGIVVAVAVNNLVKAAISWRIGGRALGLSVGAGMLAANGAMVAAAFFAGELLPPGKSEAPAD